MSSQQTSSGSGAGFAGLVALVFIVLKLTHVIDWSWWWVLSPLWGTIGAALLVLAVIVAVAIFRSLTDFRS